MNNNSHLACPCCGIENTEEIPNEGCYHCKSCGDDFFFEDTIREPIRHRISGILFKHGIDNDYVHDDENPMEFNHPVSFPSVIGIFETQDGIIFFEPNDGGEPIEFDEMSTDDLVEIVDILEGDI